jgi:hypothetical protein
MVGLIGQMSPDPFTILYFLIMRNPLPEIIPNATYRLLDRLNLLNKRGLRDLEIRKKFQDMREKGMNPEDTIDSLHQEYSQLSRHTLKKIIYSTRLPEDA